MKIAFLATTYNRKEKTKRCIESIRSAIKYASEKGMDVEESWYITDAGSTDGTVDMLKGVAEISKMHICEEKSDLYYSQGMKKSMEVFGNSINDYEAYTVFLINDDVLFYEDFLYKMLAGNVAHVLVGATEHNGIQTYGGVRYKDGVGNKKTFALRSISYSMVKTEDTNLTCHTFNANCVMIPGNIFKVCVEMDGKYIHGLGDFDLGLTIVENGYSIESTNYYVGECINNPKTGTWMDTTLSRSERIRKLQSVKGAPTKQWFYYLNKHFGFVTATVHSVTPYIRIMLGK